MSANAEVLMQQFIALPLVEQEQVKNGILGLEAKLKSWEEQKLKIREMQSRHKNRGLLKVLLDERAK
jgi:hypothetical protein